MSPSPCSNIVPPLDRDEAVTSGVGAITAWQACLERGRWFRGSDAELKARGLCLDSTGARQRLRSPWCHLYWSVGTVRFIIGSQGVGSTGRCGLVSESKHSTGKKHSEIYTTTRYQSKYLLKH